MIIIDKDVNIETEPLPDPHVMYCAVCAQIRSAVNYHCIVCRARANPQPRYERVYFKSLPAWANRFMEPRYFWGDIVLLIFILIVLKVTLWKG